METTWLGFITSNQQELSVLFSNISFLTSIQGQPQEIVAAPVDGIQDPYLATLELSTSEHLKLYNKAIFGYQKVTSMISTDLIGLTSTNN